MGLRIGVGSYHLLLREVKTASAGLQLRDACSCERFEQQYLGGVGVLVYELLRDEGILLVRPQGPIQPGDFESVAKVVDPYIEEKGQLRGIMIEAQSFPGWDSFAALLSHLRFVRDHHRLIAKIAAVSDSTILSIAPQVAKHFVKAEVRHFNANDRETALAWLRE
jgi:SpoIIAA-like